MAFLYFSIVSCIRKYGNHCIILSRACQTYQLFENKKLTKHGGKYQKLDLNLEEIIKAPQMLTVLREK